jgi:hypothetical protein
MFSEKDIVVPVITEKAMSNKSVTLGNEKIDRKDDIQGSKENRSNKQQQQQTTLFSSKVWNKPFWIWNIKEHKAADIITNGVCCFNHIVGL